MRHGGWLRDMQHGLFLNLTPDIADPKSLQGAHIHISIGTPAVPTMPIIIDIPTITLAPMATTGGNL